MPIPNRQFWESAKYNSYGFMQYYNRLTEIALSMFEWSGLPDSVDERFLELSLFADGKSLFFKDEEMDNFLSLRCTINGALDVYGIPKYRRAYAANGYNNSLDYTNSVLIYNNYLHTNAMLDVEQFARRLYEIDRTIDVNVKAQKTPVLIQCSDTEKLTFKNLYSKYEGNEPCIVTTKELNPKGFTVLQTGAPYVAGNLYTLRTNIWDEALTYLGVANFDKTKKAQLIEEEVNKSQGGTIACRNSRLETRRQACKKINKMFGLDVWCDYREDGIDLSMPGEVD